VAMPYPDYMYRFVLANNTFVLPPGWILTIALRSFPNAVAVPVSTLMSIYRCTIRWGFQPDQL
jgi:hypothetical protein